MSFLAQAWKTLKGKREGGTKGEEIEKLAGSAGWAREKVGDDDCCFDGCC